MSDRNRKKGFDTCVGKANAVLRELYCSVVATCELSRTVKRSVFKSVFVPILTCGHESCSRWRLTKYCQKIKRQRWDICEKFLVWHFVTMSTDLKFVKSEMSSHFSESRDPSYVSSAMYPEFYKKEWRTNSFGLQSTHAGKRPRVRPRTRWRDYISNLAWSRLGVEPTELSEIAVDREVFLVILVLLPCAFHSTFLFMKLSLVCFPKVNVVFK